MGGGPSLLAVLGSTLGRLGGANEARRVLDELSRLGQQRYVPAWSWISVYLGLGDREQVLAWRRRAIEDRDAMLATFRAIARMWFPENPDLSALSNQIGL